MMIGKPAQAKSVTMDQAIAIQQEDSAERTFPSSSILTSLCIPNVQYLRVGETFRTDPRIPSTFHGKTTKYDGEARRQAQNQNDGH